MRKLEFEGTYQKEKVVDFLLDAGYGDFSVYVKDYSVEVYLSGEEAMRFVLEGIKIPTNLAVFRGFDVEEHLKNTLAKELTKEIDKEIAKAIINESTN